MLKTLIKKSAQFKEADKFEGGWVRNKTSKTFLVA